MLKYLNNRALVNAASANLCHRHETIHAAVFNLCIARRIAESQTTYMANVK